MRHRSLTDSGSEDIAELPELSELPGLGPAPEQAEYVRELLLHFGRIGWPGAPRFLGVDETGHVLVEPLEGHVASHPVQPPGVWSTAALVRVARLTRQFHDLTAGTRLAGEEEVVCHTELAPRTTVYTSGELVPYAFIGWGRAAPGRRLDDLAYLCWQFLGLGAGRSSATAVGALVRLMSDAYGLTGRDRGALVEAILGCVDDETAGWIEAERAGLDNGLG